MTGTQATAWARIAVQLAGGRRSMVTQATDGDGKPTGENVAEVEFRTKGHRDAAAGLLRDLIAAGCAEMEVVAPDDRGQAQRMNFVLYIGTQG